MCRRCGEPDGRGSAEGRRARKRWLLSEESGHGGDGEKVPCWSCAELLTFETLEVDRIVPGWQCQECGQPFGWHDGTGHVFQGGSYRRGNIRPSCGPCNRQRNAGNPWQHRVEPEYVRCLTR